MDPLHCMYAAAWVCISEKADRQGISVLAAELCHSKNRDPWTHTGTHNTGRYAEHRQACGTQAGMRLDSHLCVLNNHGWISSLECTQQSHGPA